MQRVIVLILALLLCLPLVFKSRMSAIKSASTAFSFVSSTRAVVRVSGDVRHSGIYEVSVSALTKDVINMAEFNGTVNRLLPVEIAASYIVNGSDFHLQIERDGTAVITSSSMLAAERIIIGIPLDINTMSETDFDRLPGVGSVMAGRIVEYRQKNGGKMRVQDLLAVEGIGETKYQKLSKYF